MSTISRLACDRVLLNALRQKIVSKSKCSSIRSLCTAKRIPVDASILSKTRASIGGRIIPDRSIGGRFIPDRSIGGRIIGVRFASSGILPDSVVTFNPKNVEVQKPLIEPLLEGEKGTVIDLSNFLIQPEPQLEQLEAIARTFSHVTRDDLGFTWWLPTSGVFHMLDFLHGYLPWYASIAVMTAIFRVILIKPAIDAQRNTAVQSRYLPMLADAQERFEEAKGRGNKYDMAVAASDLQMAMKKANPSVWRTLSMPLFQAPFFLSTFLVLRTMAKYPVESFKDGGILWFKDLTLPDPYLLLPLLTASTMHFVIKKGVDGGANVAMMKPWLKNSLLYGVPVVIVGATYKFQAAILCYWATTNLISLGQTWIFSFPKVRRFLNIPEKKVWKPEELRKKKVEAREPREGVFNILTGFFRDLRDKYNNMKVAKKVQSYRELQAEAFERAGRGPVPQTFKYDPTKPLPKKR